MTLKRMDQMKTLFRSVLAAALLSIAGVAMSSAQAVNACYVPNVGAIYLVGLTGLPTACLNSNHVAIALGGAALPDGSVSTAKIADAAVTGAKIGAAAVGPNQIAPNAIGADQIASSAIGTAEIADRSVTTAKLNAPMSVAGVSVSDYSNLPTSAVNLGSITVVAPAAGRVVLSVTGSAYFGGDATAITVGIGSASGSTNIAQMYVGRWYGTGTLGFEETFSPSGVFNVAAGSQTFYVVAFKFSSYAVNAVNLRNVKLTALYIPN